MGYPTKIATCCYCGTRAALVLRGRDRHELACGSCGAPLHEMKMLRKDRVQDSETVRSVMLQKPKVQNEKRAKYTKPRKSKRRKGFLKWMIDDVFEEVWDEIEDIFD